jgi:hypothetical protein
MEPSGFLQVTLGGLLGSSIATAVLGALFLRRNKTVESQIKSHFDQQFNVFQSVRGWKQQSLSEVLGPLMMQFERTKAAFDRWHGKNLFLEAQIVRQGNQTIRDTLLAKGHLISPELIPHATRLVVHYDVWMEAFDRIRGQTAPEADTPFVFVGPAGYPFPREAEEAFKAEFARLQSDLYGVQSSLEPTVAAELER